MYEEIDASRDVVDFRFVMKSDEDPEEVKYFLSITDWTELELKMFINFTEPLSISKGRNKDAIICTFKNPNLFVSKETGKVLEVTTAA